MRICGKQSVYCNQGRLGRGDCPLASHNAAPDRAARMPWRPLLPDAAAAARRQPLPLVKPVVGVRVERGAKRPYYLSAKGMRPEGVYVRQGAASYMATEAEIREMLKQAEGLYHEDGRSLQQGLSFDYARESFAEHGMELGDAQMRSLGLVDEDGQFTNLGFLLSD